MDANNPFLGPDREATWEKLKKDVKPISKEALIKKAEKLRKDRNE